VGIDLGTTYSSLAYLTPQGQPVTLPNAEGELATPSAVLFDGNEIIVGTEALRHSVASPDRVVQYAKRHIGDPHHCWVMDGRVYRPKDISAIVLKKLLTDAQGQLGPIRHAVITIPAQFSDLQRQDTIDAGIAAGLEQVDLIHEPVAAALCYVLSEGMWFAELANEQTILIFDLGGGTFDLSLVKYNAKEVKVLASGGDLLLGGIDWNNALVKYVCDEFARTSTGDPRLDRESLQGVAIEMEQVKRALSTRPRSSAIITHEGRRKVINIEREQFEALTYPLLQRTETITRELLKNNKMGWAHIDAILATGGSSRMPMIRNMLQRLGGTTLNQSLSPDQSICHGAAYYAGMLLSDRKLEKTVLNRQASGRLANFSQQSVSGRSLGILIRDMKTQVRVPHYLIPANTPLPCAFRQRFGTILPGQTKVHLHIVESGASPQDPWVELGECVIEELPDGLPVSSPIDVTIRYDEQARVHLDALVVSSGQNARVTLHRPVGNEPVGNEEVNSQVADAALPESPGPAGSKPQPESRDSLPSASLVADVRPDVIPQRKGLDPFVQEASNLNPVPRNTFVPATKLQPVLLEESERPVPLCQRCGEVLTSKGRCPNCHSRSASSSQKPGQRPGQARPSGKRKP